VRLREEANQMARDREREPETRETEDFPRWKMPIVRNRDGGDNSVCPDEGIQSGMMKRTARETGYFIRVGGRDTLHGDDRE
jgi:hypothetical protein